MEPQLGADGKPQGKPHRSPTSVEITIPKLGTMVVEPPRYGAWDAEANEDLAADTLTPFVPPSGGRRVPGKARAKVKGTLADPSTRRRLALTQIALARRAEGASIQDIARELSVSPHTVTGWFVSHRRDCTGESIDALLDQIAVPLASENLIHGLLAGDKDYTLETLKGRGRFRRHAEGDAKPSTTLPELRIVFEVPTAEQLSGRDGVPAGVIHAHAQRPHEPAPKLITGPVLDRARGSVLPSAHADPEPAPAAVPDAPAALAVGRPLV